MELVGHPLHLCVFYKPTHKLYFPTHMTFDRFGEAKSFGVNVHGSKNVISELASRDVIVVLSTGMIDSTMLEDIPSYERKLHAKFKGRPIYEYDAVEEDPSKSRYIIRYVDGDFWLSGWDVNKKKYFNHSRLSSYVVEGTKKCFRLKVVGSCLLEKNLLR